eukprot:347842-Chlamydomonas_euryale.AAC.6
MARCSSIDSTPPFARDEMAVTTPLARVRSDICTASDRTASARTSCGTPRSACTSDTRSAMSSGSAVKSCWRSAAYARHQKCHQKCHQN